MQQKNTQISDQINLAIHSTEISYGFALRKNNNQKSDTFFLKNLEK